MVLYSHIHSICNVCTLQKRVIGIMSGVGRRNLFKKICIVLLLCLYILPLMMSVVDNQKHFKTNLPVHGLDTRSKNQLYLLNFICPDVSENKYTLYEVCLSFANLPCFQRGVSYSSMIFNVVPNNIENVRNDRVRFKILLHKYGPHSFYSLT
jgi:hypothetical protein